MIYLQLAEGKIRRLLNIVRTELTRRVEGRALRGASFRLQLKSTR